MAASDPPAPIPAPVWSQDPQNPIVVNRSLSRFDFVQLKCICVDADTAALIVSTMNAAGL